MIPLQDLVAEALADDGPLARTLEGFETRHSQRAMAEAVSRTLEGGGRLVAEAGTGTGKTLAYLVPAVLHRHRALVSTGTKNLQEQIVDKDVPLLQRALDVGFTVACMKGRANYVCLHRVDLARSGQVSPGPHQQHALALIEPWLAGTETGDRAEIEGLPEDSPLWPEFAASTENCLGSACPRFNDCFVTRMRQRAAESDIVVVNHHLLCADAAVRHHSFGEVIPECSVIIIDEAHQLEDVATQYFGQSVSHARIEELVRDGTRIATPANVLQRSHTDAIRRALARVEQQSRTFFMGLQQLRGGRPLGPGQGTGAPGLFDDRRRLTASDMTELETEGVTLLAALTEVEASIGLMPDASEDLRAIARRSIEIRETVRFILAAADPAFVYFFETRGRGLYLRATPIDVSSIVREHVVDRASATVFTSATLAVNGRFDYIKERLGIEDADEIQLPSDFDYARQSILYLPRRMPDPRHPAFGERAAAEIVEILGRTHGRAFVLFTSYAALRDVHSRIADTIAYPMLVQGSAPRSTLLHAFRTTPNAVLLATSSFWQGVDVVGESLSCVIIDKLPFASPGDPIIQARIEALTSAGADAFGQYQVPLAILTLLQGLGRLLRHRTDRGVLAVLDPRLRTMGYGRRFLASLPPAPITHDAAAISRFFSPDGS